MCAFLQRLVDALSDGVLPNSRFFSNLTPVPGFPADDPVVALSAGYVFWLALTLSGRVYACDTGFDGYAGLLPATIAHGGWQPINQVICPAFCHQPTSSLTQLLYTNLLL